MKAKDTVMKPLKLLEVIKYEDGEIGVSKFSRLAKAQAEISFKAGIREVVEWIGGEKVHWLVGEEIKWQAKLKEWGVE